MDNVSENARIRRITNDIQDYSDDSYMDGYHAGYDEAWDEARNKGFDEGYDEAKEATFELVDEGYNAGWDDALEKVLDEMIHSSNLVVTPQTRADLTERITHFSEMGPLCVQMTLNYLHEQMESMKHVDSK